MNEPVARRVTVRGRVQGVFFRDTTRKVAAELGVTGWVSDEPDGAVRAWVEGPASAVEQVVRFLRSGPPEASVTGIEIEQVEPADHVRFEIR